MGTRKKPTAVEILGHLIDIEFVDFIEGEVNGEFRDDIDGEFSQYENWIKIRKSRDWEDHLLHEVMHAVLELSGLDEILKDTEEAVVKSLENGLKSLVKFNTRSKFIRWKK